MNRSGKGARAERELRDLAISSGWFVIRAGGSLGAADLVLLPTTTATLFWNEGLQNYSKAAVIVQVKSNRWRAGEELDGFRDLARALGCTAILARRDDGGPGKRAAWRYRVIH